MTEEIYMRRAIFLASQAGKAVKTNPPVGAVIVESGQIIGEGFTQAFGGAHAEVMAINSVSPANLIRLQNATIYVTLEPCSHHGKTPPCTDLIIEKGLKKVVISALDPNPKVDGKGIEKLKKAGLEIEIGFMQQASYYLLRPFQKWIATQQPFITLKWAQSKDRFFGKKGEQVWLSNEYSKMLSHKLRDLNDAILVGTNTILVDTPKLNNRLWGKNSPIRVVIDRHCRIPLDHPFFKDLLPTIIYSERPPGIPDISSINEHFVWVQCDRISDDLSVVFDDLAKRGLVRILIEGGAKIHQSMIEHHHWDEAIVIRTNQKLGLGIKAPTLQGALYDQFMLDHDEVLHILNENS